MENEDVKDTAEGLTVTDEYEPHGEIDLMYPGEWSNDDGPANWFAIADDGGIFAYAGNFATAVVIRDTARMRAKVKGNLKGRGGTYGNLEAYLTGDQVK